jgi:hypothetical protein
MAGPILHRSEQAGLVQRYVLERYIRNRAAAQPHRKLNRSNRNAGRFSGRDEAGDGHGTWGADAGEADIQIRDAGVTDKDFFSIQHHLAAGENAYQCIRTNSDGGAIFRQSEGANILAFRESGEMSVLLRIRSPFKNRVSRNRVIVQDGRDSGAHLR